ncbi:MAG: hypothetical protein JW797_17365 [Bradymonadales bacterium]|nr:hypothetical protein [Bradymonadales bacterium]
MADTRTDGAVHKDKPTEEGEPTVRLLFSLDHAIPDLFAPLRLPSKLELAQEGVSPSLIRQGLIRLKGELSPGLHQVAITSKEELMVEAPAGCRIEGWARLGQRQVAQADETTAVTSAGLTFDPPLILGNVFPTLASLPNLFEDHDLTQLRHRLVQSVPARTVAALRGLLSDFAPELTESADANRVVRRSIGPREPSDGGRRTDEDEDGGTPAFGDASLPKGKWSHWLEWIKWGLREGANELTRIHLARVSVRPLERGGKAWLELRFGGRVEGPGSIPIPFRKVQLPRLILPRPHSRLDSLLSVQPLASASLHPERMRGERAVGQLLAMVKGFSGTCYLQASLPELAVQFQLADQGTTELVLPSPGELELNARLLGELMGDRLVVEVKQLDAVLDGSRLSSSVSIEVVPVRPPAGTEEGRLPRLLAATLFDPRWPLRDLEVAIGATIHDGSYVSSLRSRSRYRNPLVKGGAQVDLEVSQIRLRGDLRAHVGEAPGDGQTEETPSRVPDDRSSGSDLVEQVMGDVVGADRMEGGEEGRRQFVCPGVAPGDHLDLRFDAGLVVEPTTLLESGTTCLSPRVEGNVVGRLVWLGGAATEMQVEGAGRFGLIGRTRTEGFPELSIKDQDLVSTIEGEVEFTGAARTSGRRSGYMEADFAGTAANLSLSKATFQLDPQVLSLPPHSTFSLHMDEGVLGNDGLGRSAIRVAWDLQQRSPLLCSREVCVDLLVEELRRGKLTLHINPGGGLTITGKEGGLYDAHFFNALVNPGTELGRWVEILDDDEAVGHVISAIRLFSEELADQAVTLRKYERKVRAILREEGIEQPKDVIPGRRIALVLSRMLCDSDRLVEEIYPLVKQVTDGQGLDVPRVTRLLRENLPEHEYELELDRSVRWLKLLLSPTEPVTPFRQRTLIPLSQDPVYRPLLEGLPSAAEIYRLVDGKEPLSPAQSAMIARVAHYLTLEQLGHLLSRGREDWQKEDLARLRYLRELKQRIKLISQGYGGLSYTPQALAMAFFLGDALAITRADERWGARRAGPGGGSGVDRGETEGSWDPDRQRPGSPYRLAEGLLGPQEIAMLLHAGLTQVFQGRTVQLGRRLLIDAILEQPPFFLRQVLLELGDMNVRILASALNALLDAEQDQLSEPLDLVSLFSERLKVPFPRLGDYMAGGRFAKLSYYEELNRLAREIVGEGLPYQALKDHLQVYRHPPVVEQQPVIEQSPSRQILRLQEEAQQAIANADQLASTWSFDQPGSPQAESARAAYREAFARCAELLEQDPKGFQLPWFKAFWGRNHEALVVLGVVRNYQQDVDQVRRWLHIRSGLGEFAGESELVETVIDVLYYHEEDRVRLKADPLVRLLIESEPGELDFTVVSAMGVITEGAQGRELEDTFRRLEKRRGIRVIRANTATMRSLEYNAEQIERAVRQVKGPWGYVGYSQGCANGLRAESLLLGGTPEQRELMRGFRCRNLLFSAANGSAHGTCGDWKFSRALVQGDLFVKYYQAIFSARAIRLFLRGFRMALDSRPLVLGLGGAHSLSHAGVLALGRDGQFVGSAPTSIVRGIVQPETLPEALEFLSNVLAHQIESPLHDTQVSYREAVGHFLWVHNDQCAGLVRADMGCLIQATHHWSPLSYETEFLTTPRDRDLAIYDFPKDRHVFPWIEVNHRFGIIRRKRG